MSSRPNGIFANLMATPLSPSPVNSRQWRKVTLTLDGPFASEGDTKPNAFTDLAFTVSFAHESGTLSLQCPWLFRR